MAPVDWVKKNVNRGADYLAGGLNPVRPFTDVLDQTARWFYDDGPKPRQPWDDPNGPMGPQSGVSWDPMGPMGPQGQGTYVGESKPPRINIEDLLGGNGSSGDGGYSAAAALRTMLQQIDDSYNRQRGALDQNKATSQTALNAAMDRFRQQIGTNYADYMGQAEATQRAIAQRIAEQQATSAQRSADLQNSTASIGGANGAAIQAQAQGLMDALRASQGFQQDFSSRLGQVAANSQRQYENSGELVRQGATGTLENNYNAMLNMLLANMEQQKAQAQQSAYSGSGGGGSKASSKSPYQDAVKEQLAYRQLDRLVNNDPLNIDEIVQDMMLGGKYGDIVTYLTSLQANQNTD